MQLIFSKDKAKIYIFFRKAINMIFYFPKKEKKVFIVYQYSVNFYAASASKLNISLILSLFNVVFGFFSNTSIIRCT